jgi:hypothetical protein
MVFCSQKSKGVSEEKNADCLGKRKSVRDDNNERRERDSLTFKKVHSN